MQLIYVQLDREAMLQRLQDADDLPIAAGESAQIFDAQIPLPYILQPSENGQHLNESELEWNNIVEGILYVALYEPHHKYRTCYKNFLLAAEPELPYLLRDRLNSQCEARQWPTARDTVGILQFLFPQATWPHLELCYIYEREAEAALQRQNFAACLACHNLAAVAYEKLLENDDLTAKCFLQLAYYYLQCHNYPAAYQALVSCQQRALVPEHPLWKQAQRQLQKLHWLAPPIKKAGTLTEQVGTSDAKLQQKSGHVCDIFAQRWPSFLQQLQNSLQARTHEQRRDLLGESLNTVDQFLELAPTAGTLWYLRGFCLLYGCDAAGHANLADCNSFGKRGSASQAFAAAKKFGWCCPLQWQLPYYCGLSCYLEGDYRAAERNLLAVLQQDTEHCASLYWLEKIYEDLESPQSFQYRTLLESLDFNFPNLIEAFL